MRCHSLVVASAALLNGCGALLAPGPFPIVVDSRPRGATVRYEGRDMGTTPCVVDLHRSSCEFELALEGYHRQPVHVGMVGNRWVAANALTLGMGLAVDLALGTHQNPDTEPVLVGLAASDGPAWGPWVRVPRTAESETAEITELGRLVGLVLLVATGSCERLPPRAQDGTFDRR